MAFEEIKARLGLDITTFEQGVSKAQGSLKTMTGEMTKKFTDMKQVGQAAATALGISYQEIANGIARLVTGFSKEQEQSLKNLVDATERAADQQQASLKRAQSERQNLLSEIAKKEEEYRRSKLTDEERAIELSTRLGQIMTERNELEKQGAETSDRYLKLKNEQLDIEKELRANEEKSLDAINKTKEVTKDGVLPTEKEITDEKEKQIKLDKERTEELRKQKEELKSQAEAIQKEIETQRSEALLPTMDEVTSGERTIGYEARNTANKLEREREKSLRLADKKQVAEENLVKATKLTEGDRKNAKIDFIDASKALKESQDKVKSAEQKLGGKISDANPYKAMEDELRNIKDELTTLNKTTLSPTAIK